MRVALGVEYDGSHFCGWERQRHCEAVQEALERALSRVADHPVETTCAGRTDAGVHALAQVVHFDTEASRSNFSWMMGANANLPSTVSVHWAKPVPDDFHARFSAEARHYTYFILNRRVRPAVLAQKITWERRPLDVVRMAEAATALIGQHDFTAYRARACQARSPIRTVNHLRVTREGDMVRIEIEANAFLHHMVRNIAGVLLAIGAGEKPPVWANEVLVSRDRTQGGVTAPSDGLYFTAVRYPPKFAVPSDRRDNGSHSESDKVSSEVSSAGRVEVCPMPGLWYAGPLAMPPADK